MTEFNGFKGTAKRLADLDIPRIGERIGVGEDELHALMDVESAGGGFDKQGRPKMLFEPHVFYRNLRGVQRQEAVQKGLAYEKWKKGYPKDSYPRLIEAMKINETAALRSASWGLMQILGENHVIVGYDSIQSMVKAFMEDEANHLEAAVQFLIANDIADDLKAHRWEVVARVYNGPKYAENGYHTKMKAAYEKWRKIPDTPYSPTGGDFTPPDLNPTGVPPRPPVSAAGPEAISNPLIIKAAQQMLKDKGYTEVGAIDGIVGKQTKTAVLAFRNENGLPIRDTIDQPFLDALVQFEGRNLDRNTAPPVVVRENAPEVQTNWITKILGAGGAIVAGVTALIDGITSNIDTAREALQPIKSLFTSIPSEVWLIGATILAAAIYYVGKYGEKKGIEAYQTGERR